MPFGNLATTRPTKTIRVLATLVAFGLTSLPTRSAHAQPETEAPGAAPVDSPTGPSEMPTVAISETLLPDDLAQSDAERLDSSLREGLERAGLLVVADDAAARGVSLSVTRERSDFRVVIQLVDTADGSIVAAADETCELCGIAELAETVRAVAGRMRQRLDLARDGAILELNTDPPGASVTIDGEIVGTTPLRTKIAPGPHEVSLDLDGYRPESRTVDARAGVTDRYSVTLDHEGYRRWVPWVTLGTGVALVGGGAALLGVHDQPVRRDCNADVRGNCQFLNNTRGGGAATLVVGGALVVAGAVMAIVWRQGPRGSQQRAAVNGRGIGVRF